MFLKSGGGIVLGWTLMAGYLVLGILWPNILCLDIMAGHFVLDILWLDILRLNVLWQVIVLLDIFLDGQFWLYFYV